MTKSTNNIRVGTSSNENVTAEGLYKDTPNPETIFALLEAEQIAKDSSEKGYHDVEELFADLDA